MRPKQLRFEISRKGGTAVARVGCGKGIVIARRQMCVGEVEGAAILSHACMRPVVGDAQAALGA